MTAAAADPAPNYDESRVRAYSLPDPLVGADGRRADDPAAWREVVRPQQITILEQTVYGRRLPATPVRVDGEVERSDVELPGGVAATRIQARLVPGDTTGTDVLVYLPKSHAPVPVFLSLNFRGNQAESADPAVRLPTGWIPADDAAGIVDNRATEASRGTLARRWPVGPMVARGYGMATAYCGDFFPDRADGRPASVLPALGRLADGELPADEPGAIGSWAWGLSRILDWLLTLPEVDGRRVIVVGHSRLGKTALWAGGCDERFAMVVSNESGCGGAALSRRNFGETVSVITSRFPHWFCPTFATYADRELDLPCDQHTLLALIAPRPLYVASAVEDRWADPRGEFLAAVAAGPVWSLFGRESLGTDEYPAVDAAVGRTVGYHVRSGGHDITEVDWGHFADFADRVLEQPAVPGVDGGFHPAQDRLPVPAPADAVVLLGPAADPPGFTNMAGGPPDWRRDGDDLVVTLTPGHANHVVSTERFRDADIHVEFMTDPRAKGNSGIYIHGHYEMQIYDSCGVDPPTDQDEGSLYRFAKPLVAAARPTGEWQVYDIRYTAPRRDATGAITTLGSITAWLNGRLVQDGVTFGEPRSPYIPYRHGVTPHLRAIERELLATGAGPLFLQDHGSPTRFRNVWIRHRR